MLCEVIKGKIHHWWQANIGLDEGDNPFLEPMAIKLYEAIWCHYATMSLTWLSVFVFFWEVWDIFVVFWLWGGSLSKRYDMKKMSVCHPICERKPVLTSAPIYRPHIAVVKQNIRINTLNATISYVESNKCSKKQAMKFNTIGMFVRRTTVTAIYIYDFNVLYEIKCGMRDSNDTCCISMGNVNYSSQVDHQK